MRTNILSTNTIARFQLIMTKPLSVVFANYYILTFSEGNLYEKAQKLISLNLSNLCLSSVEYTQSTFIYDITLKTQHSGESRLY